MNDIRVLARSSWLSYSAITVQSTPFWGNCMAALWQGAAYFDDMQLRAMTEPGLARFGGVSFADLPASSSARA